MKELGQLFMIGVSGAVLTEEEREFISSNNIGGVILFSHNFESVGQLSELINSIQQLREEYPLFISVDQEGGRVRRFKKDFTQFPAMLEVSRQGSPKLIYEIHEVMAKELSACGVNLNYAPVCDIFTNSKNTVIGDRAFGSTVEEVEKFVSAAIRGLQTNRVIACAKHFPGHGDSTKDSHYDLPIIKTDGQTLRNRELQPFQKAVKSRVETMMMAHLVVDAIDPELPTSLSPKAYQFLRDELRYKKVILTDDMEMKAIIDRYDIGNASYMALKAGADILVFRSFENSKKAFEYVKQKIKTKELLHKDIEDKLSRILELKKDFLPSYVPLDPTTVLDKIQQVKGKDLLKQIDQSLVSS